MNIDDRISVSIGELIKFSKREGLTSGNVKWSSGSSISFRIDFVREEMVLSYTFQNEESVEERILLVRKPTNLNIGVQWYAVCPSTGKKCRKLFLYGGWFVSRYAIPETYSTCNRSRKQRITDQMFSILVMDENAKYRKEYYNGKLTPYGRKCCASIDNFRRLYQSGIYNPL